MCGAESTERNPLSTYLGEGRVVVLRAQSPSRLNQMLYTCVVEHGSGLECNVPFATKGIPNNHTVNAGNYVSNMYRSLIASSICMLGVRARYQPQSWLYLMYFVGI